MWGFVCACAEGGIAPTQPRLLLPRVWPVEAHCSFGRQAADEMERD